MFDVKISLILLTNINQSTTENPDNLNLDERFDWAKEKDAKVHFYIVLDSENAMQTRMTLSKCHRMHILNFN